MKKRFLSFLLAFSIVLGIAPSAFAKTEGFPNFRTVYTYKDGQFTDIPANSWYLENVKSSYELGLVKGASETTFNPMGNLSIAETLAFACRLHNIYYGESGKFEQGTPWYKVYVDYAKANNIITSEFSNYDAKASRALFATIMASTLPGEALSAINNIEMGKIPDVPSDKDYANSVYRLYNAGILTGNDGYGTFNPDSNIQRCEAAALVTRMADPSLRKTFTLEVNPEPTPEPEVPNIEDVATAKQKTALMMDVALDSLKKCISSIQNAYEKKAIGHHGTAYTDTSFAYLYLKNVCFSLNLAVKDCGDFPELSDVKNHLKYAYDSLDLYFSNTSSKNINEATYDVFLMALDARADMALKNIKYAAEDLKKV